MEKTKITNKSRYAAIINVLTGAPSDIETDELVNFCERQIDAIDRKSEKARARAAEQRKVSDELTERIAAMLTDEPQTLGELAAAIGDEDIANVIGALKSRMTMLALGKYRIQAYQLG